MENFDFSLEDVLELRSDRERELAAELADARERHEEARRDLRRLRARRSSARERIDELQGSGEGSAGAMQSLLIVADRLGEHIGEAERRLRAAEEDVAERRREFEDALRERQVVERLRERRLAQWRDERSRAERKRMDEIAINRHGTDGATGDRSGGEAP
ncbi:MAG: flagellar export protein FliJ [Candidatus Palauibacterales bacterium]|nr:flagellar export protein FliJ [Candidatus Palauibacterales bacterium]